MYENIGDKIKKLAEALTLIGIMGSLFTGILMMTESFLIGILVMLGGSLISWLSSFILYGFGQLIENTDILVSRTEQFEKQNTASGKKSFTKQDKGYSLSDLAKKTAAGSGYWVCKKCGTKNETNRMDCKDCGEYR